MTEIKMIGRGLRGESFSQVVRREGSIGGIPVPEGASDADILNLMVGAVAITGANAYPDTASGLAAVSEGESFWVADAAGLRLYRDVAGVATLVSPFTSADNISESEGTTVQAKLDLLGSVTNVGGGAPNFQRGGFNYVSTDADASEAVNGTLEQPNAIGVDLHEESFTGNGSTASFNTSPGWTAEDEEYLNVRVWRVTLATGAETLLNEGSNVTVTGYGTGTLTIAPSSTLAATEGLRVRVWRKADAGNNPLLNGILGGYDNVTDGAGSMELMVGAHHTLRSNTGGHNTIFGGSSGSIVSSSYSITGQLSNKIVSALGAAVWGIRNYATGTGALMGGASNRANSYCFAVGEGNSAETVYSTVIARRGKARIGGDFVMGLGQASDGAAGLMDPHQFPLRRMVTSTTSTTLIPASGSSIFAMEDNSVATVEVDLLLVDTANLDFRWLRLVTTIERGAGAATTAIAGPKSGIADQQTEIDATTGLAPSAGEWSGQIVSSATGGFAVIAKGKAGRNIQALARVRSLFIAASAAAV